MLRRLRCIALVAVFFTTGLSGSVRAEFISNYSEWYNLDKTNKALYAAGLVDGGGTRDGYLDINDNRRIARIDGMLKCIGDNKLNGELLAQMIDNAYAKNVNQWPNPPSYIVTAELEKLCQPWLDRSRKRLDPSGK